MLQANQMFHSFRVETRAEPHISTLMCQLHSWLIIAGCDDYAEAALLSLSGLKIKHQCGWTKFRPLAKYICSQSVIIGNESALYDMTTGKAAACVFAPHRISLMGRVFVRSLIHTLLLTLPASLLVCAYSLSAYPTQILIQNTERKRQRHKPV